MCGEKYSLFTCFASPQSRVYGNRCAVCVCLITRFPLTPRATDIVSIKA